MFHSLFLLFIFITISSAQDKRYFIQLGSFKDQRLLERNIAQIPKKLRSHIVVVKSNRWLIPFAYHTPNRAALQRKLPAYQRYFPDAVLSSSSYILNHRVVLNYVRQKEYIVEAPQIRNRPKIVYHQVPRYRPRIYQDEQYIAPEASVVYHPEVAPAPENFYKEESTFSNEDAYSKSIMELEEEETFIEEESIVPSIESYTDESYTERKTVPIPTPTVVTNTGDIKRYRHFSPKMLSGKHYYLAYKATQNNPNLLIRVKFGTHRVTYQPIVGEMQMADAYYIVDNRRLYMYAENFSEDGAYSKIEAQRVDHILVSSWSGGKKLNTLRYYFRITDAKQYLNIEQSSDKLSEAIEEGLEYDWGLDL
jgi:hypothetical protein